METDGSSKGSSSNQLCEDSQDSKVQINIKTLDSHLYPFNVERNIPVTSLKEKIANTTGVPVGQQRLIFRGRVLKDDHILSDYHIENGHTLHLVARQPVQSQSQSGEASDEASRGNTTGSQGNGIGDAMPHARIGHSVVLGVNISDEEGTAADLSRIIGSVLNSFGIGTASNLAMAGNQTSNMSNATGQTSQGVTGPQNGNGSVDQQARNPSLQQTGNPSLQNINGVLLRQMAIPDSISTIATFISRIEQGLSMYSGYRAPSSNSQDSVQSPPTPVTGPSPDALISIMGQAQRLLSGAAVASLSHLSERLERERASADLFVRSQVQAEALHAGVMMQHLGSLCLELGRTISTLRVGEAPTEVMVNSGPAVYINSSGPNPLMVQPVPHQPSPMFGIPSIPPLVNVGFPDPARVGDIARNINIHLQAGAPGGLVMGNAGAASRGQTTNQGSANIAVNAQQDPGSVRRLSSRTIVTAVPAHTSGGSSHGSNVILPVDMRVQSSNSTQSSVASSTTSSLDAGLQANVCNDAFPVASGSKTLDINGSSLNSSVKKNNDESGSSRASSLVHSSDVGTSSVSANMASDTGAAPEYSKAKQAPKTSSGHDMGSPGRLVDSSSIHASSSGHNNDKIHTPLGLGLGGLKPKKRSKPSVSQEKPHGQNPQLITQGQQVLQSLVSQTRQEKASPSGYSVAGADISGTAHVRQNQNLGGAFSGIFQQMMPVLSQAFGASSSRLPSTGETVSMIQDRAGEDAIDVHQAVQGIERQDHASLVFHDLLDAAARLSGEGSYLVDLLGSEEDLANEFVQMMRRDIQRRLDTNSNQH